MKFLGLEWGKKAEAPANEAPAENVDAPAPVANQEVAPVKPDAAVIGAEANKLAALAEVDKFAAAIDAEASTTGSLDRPAAPTDTPVSNEVVSAEIAALPETPEPVAPSTETFQVPEAPTQEVAPAPEVAPHIEASAPVANQEIAPAPVEAPVTVDARADATAAPESDAMWKQFDTAEEASTAVASAPVKAAPAVETPEQNQ